MIRKILSVGILCLYLAGCAAPPEGQATPEPVPSEAAPTALPEERGPVPVWSGAAQDTVQSAELFYYSGGGEQAESRLVFGTELAALLEVMDGLEAPAAAEYGLPEERCALYGVRLVMTERDFEGISCGDTFLTNEGGIYQLSGDFLEDAWNSAGAYPYSALPNLRSLQVDGEGQWRPAFLSEDLGGLGAEADMDVTAQDERGVTFTITNHDSRELTYGAYTALEVELDGRWYAVAPAQTHYAWNSMAYVLAPGKTSEPETFFLDAYAPLPEGHYRLVKTLGETRCAAEFERKE